ncbi:hypothetical protein N7495_003150 [Penicillium taxi]|uniref:uncharacterized protein n=1 Tax=Penicillium taxi TaxID=168475 RepID=UPI0025455377|nr:uncharacterized protein N7495_003150 [Penicillium taxi]KAJ5902622.1 hypothetical protein N7495_003150 [Penicillium taxi]
MAQSDSSPSASTQKEFHIFGWGISFSISPIIHNAAFKHFHLPYTYDIRESSVIDGVEHLIKAENFGGASVTMPHKLEIHKFLQDQTESAKLIGAINTVIVKGSGKDRILVGENTDCSGLQSLIKSYVDKTQHQPKTGLVIGAGGASRAAVYALHKQGVEKIYLANRTLANAEQVKVGFRSLFEVEVLPLESLEKLPNLPDIIIGTVPANVTVEEQFSSIFSSTGGLCIEMAYKPRQTPLLNMARKNEGWHTVTGLEVLLAQAFDQFHLWTGLEAPQKEMTEAVVAHETKQEAKTVL